MRLLDLTLQPKSLCDLKKEICHNGATGQLTNEVSKNSTNEV